MFVDLLMFMPIATMLNMVTALVTEADKPAIIAKHQRRITMIKVLIIVPCLNLSIGLNKKFRISKTIPTCKPETARI